MRSNVKNTNYSLVFFLAIFLLTVTGYVYPAPLPSKEVERKIRNIYADANKLIESQKVEIIILYSEAGKDGYDIKNWHLASSKSNYERGADEARIFIANGHIIKTRLVTQSLSGDWAYVVEYYYYQNGDVAFIYEGNTTYNGYIIKNGEKATPDSPFVVEKRSYFSEYGTKVKSLSKAFLRDSGEPVPLSQIQDINPNKYGSVCTLPFIKLIREKIKMCK